MSGAYDRGFGQELGCGLDDVSDAYDREFDHG